MFQAKCLEVFVVLAGLGVLWIFYRRKTNQIMLAIALTILVGGIIRLINLKDNTQTFYTIGLVLVAMAVVWVGSWLSNRSAIRRRRATRVEPTARPRGRDV